MHNERSRWTAPGAISAPPGLRSQVSPGVCRRRIRMIHTIILQTRTRVNARRRGVLHGHSAGHQYDRARLLSNSAPSLLASLASPPSASSLPAILRRFCPCTGCGGKFACMIPAATSPVPVWRAGVPDLRKQQVVPLVQVGVVANSDTATAQDEHFGSLQQS